jgi:hypothetical protein
MDSEAIDQNSMYVIEIHGEINFSLYY